MKVKFYGVRGSIPVCGPDFQRYGGNTTCLRIAREEANRYIREVSYGLRIEDDSQVLTICTDVEHIDGIDETIVELARDADLLLHDGQYTDDEHVKYRGWGHSTWRQAVEVAKRANVKKLVIIHHDPDHDDDMLDSMERECQKEFPNSVFAKEVMEVGVSLPAASLQLR